MHATNFALVIIVAYMQTCGFWKIKAKRAGFSMHIKLNQNTFSNHAKITKLALFHLKLYKTILLMCLNNLANLSMEQNYLYDVMLLFSFTFGHTILCHSKNIHFELII